MSSSFRDLRVWQESIDLTTEIYKATAFFPKQEIYGLTQQIRRAAVSIASNIAEGKGSDKEFLHFLFHARGSLLELQTQLEIAGRLGYLAEIQPDLTSKAVRCRSSTERTDICTRAKGGIIRH